MPWIEPEQLATAKAVDLYSYLTVAEPGNIKRCGQDEWRLVDHDSLKVSASNGKWNWHSRGFGGTTAVQYLMKVRGYTLPEAAQMVLDSRAAPYLPHVAQEPPKPFELPPRHTDAEKVIKYLCGERCVSREIVAHCLDSGQLYESAYYHSCVFVGYDEAHRPRHAAIRATGGAFMQDMAGSDKRYSFALQAQNMACTTLYVFESAIDALSLATMRQIQGEAWRDIHYLSLAGVSALPIEQFLNHHPEIVEIRLCLDADEPGQLAAERITNVLHLSRPQLKILYKPPKVGKDYNRQLQIFARLKVRLISKPTATRRGCERA